MNIRAVKYCQNEFGLFGGMQLLVGFNDPESWIPLRMHGTVGGECLQW